MSESRTTKEGIVNYQAHIISYSYVFTIQNAYQQEHNWTYTAQKTFFPLSCLFSQTHLRILWTLVMYNTKLISSIYFLIIF